MSLIYTCFVVKRMTMTLHKLRRIWLNWIMAGWGIRVDFCDKKNKNKKNNSYIWQTHINKVQKMNCACIKIPTAHNTGVSTSVSNAAFAVCRIASSSPWGKFTIVILFGCHSHCSFLARGSFPRITPVQNKPPRELDGALICMLMFNHPTQMSV